jgi:hypothetical protein
MEVKHVYISANSDKLCSSWALPAWMYHVLCCWYCQGFRSVESISWGYGNDPHRKWLRWVFSLSLTLLRQQLGRWTFTSYLQWCGRSHDSTQCSLQSKSPDIRVHPWLRSHYYRARRLQVGYLPSGLYNNMSWSSTGRGWVFSRIPQPLASKVGQF